jgi:V/A-type H+/Na+-transporting ATPase subunit I
VFSAVPMMHLRVLVLERDVNRVLRSLGESGVVQLTRSPCGPDTAPLPPRDRTGELARCAQIRGRIDKVWQLQGTGTLPGGRSYPEMTLDEAEKKVTSIEEKVSDPAEGKRTLSARRDALSGRCTRAANYRGLGIPLNGDQPSSFIRFVTGSVPSPGLEELRKTIDPKVVLLPLGQLNDRQSVVVVMASRNLPSVERALEEAGFQRDVLDGCPGASVDASCEAGERELLEIEAELKMIDEELEGFAAEFGPCLSDLKRFVDIKEKLLSASQKCPRTETVVLITGWVPAHAGAGLDAELRRVTAERYRLEAVSPDDAEEEVPVLLRHSRLLRPFETLVSTYGLPTYRELEPTLFVAVSYLLMFGVMFGDAGHGLVLALCGLFVALRFPGKRRDFGLLLLFAGLSSIIFGIIYGSWFGVEHFKKYALWHDPLEGDPIRLMYATIGFGVVMISLGILLNVINRLRRGDVIGGILDKFGLAGLLFYWGALVLFTNKSFFSSKGILGVAMVGLLGVPMVSWVVKEPLEHFLTNRSGGHGTGSDGIGGVIMEAFVGAFEAILSYLANSISFVRLAAYAMSHAAILVAAFMLAAQVRGFSPGGGFWSVIIVILGNLIAIVLEGIIASVQALRLEYYEFFGKFFSGNGQPFEPFRLAEDREAQVF